jgi:hypothetical protein
VLLPLCLLAPSSIRRALILVICCIIIFSLYLSLSLSPL